jgi:hypothetical protein
MTVVISAHYPTLLPGVPTSRVIARRWLCGHRGDVSATGKGSEKSFGDTGIPRWLRFVLRSDRAGSSWYVGAGFFFAPVLAVLSPWPALTALLSGFIALAGLWLGLLGLAMATGLAMVLRTGREIPEDYWRGIVDYPSAGGARERGRRDGGGRDHRC